MKKICIAIVMLSFCATGFARETTSKKNIDRLQKSRSNTYVYNSSGWGAPSCPSAKYAQIPDGLSVYKELFTIALAARVAGDKIFFQGECNGSNYFVVDYIAY